MKHLIILPLLLIGCADLKAQQNNDIVTIFFLGCVSGLIDNDIYSLRGEDQCKQRSDQLMEKLRKEIE